ncbi:hypothetical protein FIBSPDRAFT_1041031, partial [Athelia psychrophila]
MQCFVSIPFTGSGATVYVIQGPVNGVNASWAVDNQPLNYVSPLAPMSSPAFQLNVSLLSVQGLVSGSHTLVLTALDYGGNSSYVYLDSVIINDTVVNAPTSSSSFSSATSTTTLSASNS